MARRIETIDEMRPNVFEAIKRAFIKRGIVPRGRQRPAEVPPIPASTAKPEPKDSKKSRLPAKSQASPEKEKKSDETYPEKVADGESDSKIESESQDEKENLDKLKSEAEGSKTAKGPAELAELTEKSLDVLFEATTVFPFTLFPDTLTLDREKLTIAKRHFWQSATITSVPVGEIMSAEALVGPFFGSLDLTFRFFANNERKVSFLWRDDAIELQRLIHGYIIAHRREIDVSSVNKKELIELLSTLGQGASD